MSQLAVGSIASPTLLAEFLSSTAPTLRISNGGGTSPAPMISLYRLGGVEGQIIYDPSIKRFDFNNASAGGVIRFLQAGTVVAQIDVNGNFAPSAGKGIDFSATSDAAGMTSELLDDYEEGTWTPSITASTPGDLTVAFSSQSGVYTKIGRTVTVTFFLATSTFTHSTASGSIRISGLPFTVSNTAGATSYSNGALASQGWTKANYGVTLASVQNATEIRMVATGSAQNLDNLLITDFATGNLVMLRGSITYIV
jgi:hypothetical protein